jgi:predicted aspartyl protease
LRRENGKNTCACRHENLLDLCEVSKGNLKPEEVRKVEVKDALVDTGATFLSLPKRYIQQLGLQVARKRKAKTTGGIVEFNLFNVARLTVQGRECTVEVAQIPDECPVLIGQMPLEALDFLVDPMGQRLLGNPEHGGEQMMELYLSPR